MNSRLLCSIAAATMLIAACQNTPTPAPTPEVTPVPSEEPIPTATPVVKGQAFKIYSSLPLAGHEAEQSKSIVNGINLAIEQKTASGTLCDGIFKITTVSLDDASPATGAWSMEREQENAYKAVTDTDAMAYIGPFDSGAARVSMPILNKGSIAIVNPSADYVGLTKPYAPSDPDVYFEMGKRNFMRLAPPVDLQGAAAVRLARILTATKVFIVDDAEQYGRGPSDVFASAAQKAGLSVVGREAVSDQADNLPFIASKILISRADFIYYGGSDPAKAALFLNEARKEKINAVFMGTSALMNKAFTDGAGDLAQGVYATSFGMAESQLSPKGQAFARDYESHYTSKPDIYAFTGYEAASVIIAAAGNVCQKDRVALLDAMFNTLDFDGVLGKWSFDANGDINLHPFVGNKFDKGTWQTTGPLAPESP
ncbi:MAG: branched-chain amino acid ABC transporter substrate-binding protein [Chloroflexi bacterium]|nr:branched-chain amino acid ABC transporter substrate-binding protein [Chloroflexota bacterium]MCL5275445.1 branched-chain amino acid ABC transporter substrate-binding protein [Chloroflexota bacterium]